MAMERNIDIKEMIQREIHSISALKERVIFKDIMEGVFLNLYEKNEEMYKRLETRVMDDLAYDINRYQIRTGLVEKTYLDTTHHVLTAVCKEDMQTSVLSTSDIWEELERNGKACLSTVFVKGDSMEIQKLLGKDGVYSGILQGEKEYSVSVRLEPSRRYLKQMERLYHLFMKNGVPWQTINAPYLFKMMDIMIYDLPKEILQEQTVKGFAVNFEEYTSIIHYDMVPLWSVWHLQLESIGFPIPCGDYKNFEHTISIQDYGIEHAYLLGEKAGLRSVRQNGDRLLATGEIRNAEKWDVYMIRNGEQQKIERHQYPIMENLRKDGFTERFLRKSGQRVKTRAELERFIRGFALESYIEYQDCRLEDESKEMPETYSMNFFIKDEIRDQKGRRRLILSFKGKGEEVWLLRDIASFIVSEVQELYPEYQCEGQIL